MTKKELENIIREVIYENINNIILSPKDKFTFKETFNAFDEPDYLFIYKDGKKLTEFYYNMRGFIPNFTLTNGNGVQASFGELSKSKSLRLFKNNIKQGFVNLHKFN